MSKYPRKSGLNVVPLPAKTKENRGAVRDFPDHAVGVIAAAGTPDDPRMKEAVRLMEAFLAIEDAQGRAALITLAERLVSYEWVRKVQQR